MALWKQALAKLRGSAPSASGPVPADVAADIDVAVADDPTDEVAAAGDSDAVSTAVDRNALARELQSGLQVSIGDLDSCSAGWRYRGHPVMVFGTDAPELDDPRRRRDFYSLVHVFPCCGALQSESRSAWVGTDLKQINESHGQGPFTLCKACLEAAAGRGASAARFEFTSHVRSHGDSYFADSTCYWRPGVNSLPLQLPADAVEHACPHCGCAAEEGGWHLSADDAQQLALPEGSCLLCAERRVDGCMHFASEQLLTAARVRYRYLVAQAAKAPAPSWKLAEAILPLGWQPLLQSLQRILPAPELFFSFAESASPAVLAWPALSRGIVESVDNEAQQGAADWSLWTRAQIEAELGFKLR
ncbi:hypothetical protein SAMN04487965_2434 [Microbulbifer donghaiensis]|uniref:Uncharacterized protein n=1 Tax=Microbulbifer donghaiensis TaxID=494016 RepID=A0A1M5D8B0_9GAMM|nr:hypothetical protein [Microbulbifer donghaiensis]SHF63105.1 hypothetical protein SAMN04487965_2434 [Microbulbifer donghaiensis]